MQPRTIHFLAKDMTSNKKLRQRDGSDKPASNSKNEAGRGLMPPKNGEHPNAPAPLMDLVYKFLQEFGYERACRHIRVETQERETAGGSTKPCSWMDAGKKAPSLVKLWNEWQEKNPGFVWLPESQPSDRKKAELSSKVSGQTTKASMTTKASQDEIDTDDVTTSDEEESDDENDAATASAKPQSLLGASSVPLPDSDEESSGDESDSEESDSGNSDDAGKSTASAVVAKEKEVSMSDSSGSEEYSSSESEGMSGRDEAVSAVEIKPVANPLKRKAPNSSSEDSSASSSDSGSESDDEPQMKKAKIQGSDSSSSDKEEGSSSESSSGNDTDEEMKDACEDHSSQSSGSDSSGTSSSDSTSGESDQDEKPAHRNNAATAKKAKTGLTLPATNGLVAKKRNGSESSVTLHATSPEFKPTTDPASADADATNGDGRERKKTNTPFQRVPSNIKIDPKFASNDYISYDYADRAHRDLSVVKGKGFTKEKNKKKRGSYKGGAIDTSGGRSIKFED